MKDVVSETCGLNCDCSNSVQKFIDIQHRSTNGFSSSFASLISPPYQQQQSLTHQQNVLTAALQQHPIGQNNGMKMLQTANDGLYFHSNFLL